MLTALPRDQAQPSSDRFHRYMAPEILQEVGHSFAVDWWCLGVLIFEMHTGHTPFVSQNKKEMYINILKNPPVYPASFPPLARDLCNLLLHKDPKSRLGASSQGGRDIQVPPSIRPLLCFRHLNCTPLLQPLQQ